MKKEKKLIQVSPGVMQFVPKNRVIHIIGLDMTLDMDEMSFNVLAYTDDDKCPVYFMIQDNPDKVKFIINYGITGILDYVCDELLPLLAPEFEEFYQNEHEEEVELVVEKETVPIELATYRGTVDRSRVPKEVEFVSDKEE